MGYEYATRQGPLGSCADLVGPVLLAIEQRDGNVTPEAVVEAAAKLPAKHPLRRYVWGVDDTEAAARYRLIRASEVIRSVSVILRADGKAPVTARLMLGGADRGSFQNVHVVMSNDELREQTMGQAARDAEDFKARYRFLRETAAICREIESFVAMTKVAGKANK